MVLDLVALALLGIFGLVGALRGGVASALGLLTLVSSYLGAVWCAQHLGTPLSEKAGVSPIFAPVIAGTIGFFVTALVVGGLGTLVRRAAAGLRGNSPLSTANRWAGGLLGVVRGLLVVVLLSYLVIWLDAARESGAFEGLESVPDVRLSSAAKATEKIVETTVHAVVDGDGAGSDVAARLASRPAVAVKSLQAILADPRIEDLQGDRFFWTLIEDRAYHRAMNQASFRAISQDRGMRARFADLGVVEPKAVDDPRLFEQRFGEVLLEVGPRLKGLVDDPDMQALARDPEVLAMLESGDTLGLVRHEGVQNLVAKVSQQSR